MTTGIGSDEAVVMSVWESQHVLDAVVEALESVHLVHPGGHHLGRPYVTSYQIAIKVDHIHPNIRQALTDHPLGGAGTGTHHSFAQYLGRELSGRIRRAQDAGEHYAVEGAFLSNEHITSLSFKDTTGYEFTSSLTGTNYDLGIFRLTGPPQLGAEPG